MAKNSSSKIEPSLIGVFLLIFVLLCCFSDGTESFAKFSTTGALIIWEVDDFCAFIGKVFFVAIKTFSTFMIGAAEA